MIFQGQEILYIELFSEIWSRWDYSKLVLFHY
jgi:hypothetical protein